MKFIKFNFSHFFVGGGPWLLGFVVILCAALGFGGYEYWRLAVKLEENKIGLASTTSRLADKVFTLTGELSLARAENARLNGSLVAEKGKNDLFESQIGQLSTTVGTLKKLSETDKEFLQKYSKVYFLNEHYVPQNLATIDLAYLQYKDRTARIHEKVLPFLKRLLDDARKESVTVEINSA